MTPRETLQVKMNVFSIIILIIQIIILSFPICLIRAQNTKNKFNSLKTHTFQEGYAQGKSFFTTYDTDNGLTMDVISSGNKSALCDKDGNLWFGTSGGGVSRYDGKHFTTYSTAHGLANDIVLSIFQDKIGNIWFGTYGGGISKYDGTSFTSYTTKNGLGDNRVFSINEDNNGNIWFGTDGGGVTKYNGDVFINYTNEKGLSGNYVRSILEDKNGNIWFGTNGNGVNKVTSCYFNTCKHDLNDQENITQHNKTLIKSFKTYNFKQVIQSNKVYCILEDENDYLWFGTEGDGIIKYNTKKANNNQCSLGVCKHDLTNSNHLEIHNKELTSLFTNYKTEHGLSNNFIRCLTEDAKGNIWIGTYGGGVIKYDANKATPCHFKECNHNLNNKESLKIHNKTLAKQFTTYTTDNGLPNNKVLSITEDKNGSIWFGTEGGGVTKYNGSSFIIYNEENGLPKNRILSIVEDKKGNIWFGTYKGVSKYDGKTFITYTINDGLPSNVILSILEDKKGNIWFGTSGGGASKYNGKSFITYTKKNGVASNIILSIIEDKKGNIWFGTSGGGVSKYDGEIFTSYSKKHGLANNYIIGMIEDKEGNIWFGTWGGGISKFNNSAIIETSKKFTSYTENDGLADNKIMSILEDRTGNIWFGTYGGGVNILKKEFIKNESLPKFISINKSDGLPNNGVTALVEDDLGNIIIGTNHGLGVIPFGKIEEKIEIYNQFTGYPIRDVNGGTNNGSLFCDSKGNIWVGTGSDKTALIKFNYNAINRDSQPPKTVIQSISIKGEKICWYSINHNTNAKSDSIIVAQQELITYGKKLQKAERDSLKNTFSGITFSGITKFYPLPKKLILPYNQNHISFDFLAIETDRNFLIDYQYMLEGQDKNWSSNTSKTDVTFTNLYEGNYTFLLKAKSPWGIWSKPIQYNFKVLPPWYRTWWAYLLYIIIGISSIRYIVFLKTKKLKFRQIALQGKVDKATVAIREQNVILEKQKDELAKKHDEKKAMLQEIHHRVKNNLQVVNSLFKFQSRAIEDERVLSIFKKAQKRVLSMALLHEKMYRSDNLKHINVKDHITLLVEDLIQTYVIGINIKLDVDIAKIENRNISSVGLNN